MYTFGKYSSRSVQKHKVCVGLDDCAEVYRREEHDCFMTANPSDQTRKSDQTLKIWIYGLWIAWKGVECHYVSKISFEGFWRVECNYLRFGVRSGLIWQQRLSYFLKYTQLATSVDTPQRCWNLSKVYIFEKLRTSTFGKYILLICFNTSGPL